MGSRATRSPEHALVRAQTPDGQVRRRDMRVARIRIDPFPFRLGRRWLLRLALATPFAAIAMLADRSPIGASPNDLLIQRVQSIDWARADASWLGEIMPPFSSILALVAPNKLVLGLVGAIAAGSLIRRLIEIMVQRHMPAPVATLLVLALAVNPLIAYTAVENVAAMLGIACFAVGITHATRFVMWANTRSGFIAGIAFMVGALCDPAGIAAVVAIALVIPLARLGRKGQPGARWANLLVLVFPTVAAFGTMFILAWIFTGTPMTILQSIDFASSTERWHSLLLAFQTQRGMALLASLAVAWIAAVVLRSVGVLLGSTLIFVSQLVAYVIGLIPQGSAGNIYILLTLCAVAFLPTARSLAKIGGLTAVGVLQILVGWWSAFSTPIVMAWLQALNPGG